MTKGMQPDGQITKNLSSPLTKNIPLSPSGKSALSARAIPSRKRGVRDRHERWARDAVDAEVATDERG